MGAATRLYLTGADGMLGTALTAALAADPVTGTWRTHGVSRADFDIADAGAVTRSIESFRPDVVVHTAAHAVVDDCERDPARALRVNVAGVRNVAEACRRTGSRLVYLSSDYVFDGTAPPEGGYRETDLPSPLSVYGATKLAGERICAVLGERALSVRTSWLFGGADERVDVVLAALRQAAEGRPAALVADQYSLPTYTADLARALVFLLTRPEPVSGTLHVANAGTASWYDVGLALHELRPDVPEPKPLAMAECGFVGGRPRDSSLCTERLAGLGLSLPHWRDALQRFCARH
ncbi:dTDP-4-dehydrorhamnose reductase [Streptomyces sp. TRM70350]|uniref:dTDP-4-dehydrorhamnose reductase n=1 Tax=Streptomyces sp. TRM70350 TaxID=2856165 RepID=UPI001C44CE65|nr:dTDP-4-dehydrorhamnose reductase [Streptomyces sp. TRM70350]MBV7696597.1 dTDP-4-dehydrorhamnose reductase [Streptomyces sp. TRM70350]